MVNIRCRPYGKPWSGRVDSVRIDGKIRALRVGTEFIGPIFCIQLCWGIN
jgi:hypothetical protein